MSVIHTGAVLSELLATRQALLETNEKTNQIENINFILPSMHRDMLDRVPGSLRFLLNELLRHKHLAVLRKLGMATGSTAPQMITDLLNQSAWLTRCMRDVDAGKSEQVMTEIGAHGKLASDANQAHLVELYRQVLEVSKLQIV